MAKKSFLLAKRVAQKNMKSVVTKSALRGGAAVGSYAVLTAVKPKIPVNMQKLTGVAMFAIGTAADVFLADENMKAAAQGIAVTGMIELVRDNAPETLKTKLGLSGVEETSLLGYQNDLLGLGSDDMFDDNDLEGFDDDLEGIDDEDFDLEGIDDEDFDLEGIDDDEDFDLEGIGNLDEGENLL